MRLPAGVQVNFVRIQYNNAVAGNAGAVLFTSYDGQGGFADHITAASGSDPGFGAVASPTDAVTADPANRMYALVWIPGVVGNQLCGGRLAYVIP